MSPALGLSFYVSKILSALFLPPLGLILLAMFGFWFFLRSPKSLGIWLLVGALAMLWLLSVPWIASSLLSGVEVPCHRMLKGEAEAIVILGGGVYRGALEYDEMISPNARTLERIRYGAMLSREKRKPILVTGGAVETLLPEAVSMRNVLEKEFLIPVRWVEDRSRTTRENARFSAEILHREGIKSIYLVSHGWHLKRAITEFEREGFRVVPAATVCSGGDNTQFIDFLPTPHALVKSYYAIRETLGYLWYVVSRGFS